MTKEERNSKRREFYKANRELVLAKLREYRANNPEVRQRESKRRRILHADRVNAAVLVWRTNNAELCRKYCREYKKRSSNVVRAGTARRRATKSHRTPRWADLQKITEFYKNCPLGYHVDHIIPLHGKNISGLHTIDNLQYLPAIENLKKGNRF